YISFYQKFYIVYLHFNYAYGVQANWKMRLNSSCSRDMVLCFNDLQSLGSLASELSEEVRK
ncbi:MAG TPA: hypothetical protein VN414_13920, partial [Methanosarcina sp.]|nr:hypothetical protein [Methanosarcina sp.]